MSSRCSCPPRRPGDIVVRDKLSPPKRAPTWALLRQAGAQVRFRPADSPDLHPIEMMGSKVKQWRRTVEARPHPEPITAMGQALARVTPQDALNWFAPCGYSFC